MYDILRTWNDQNPIMAIGRGDKIVKVNNKTSLEEIKAELAAKKAFTVEIESRPQYPAVLSQEAMNKLKGNHPQSAFDPSVPNILLSYEIKKQQSRYVNFFLKEYVSEEHSCSNSENQG